MPASRPLLVVVAGRPGTGKTTLARALTGALDAAYLRIDLIGGPILRATVADDTSAAEAAYQIAHELAEENLTLGVPIVVDGLHATHARREAWVNLAAAVIAGLEYVETFVSDLDEHRRRV